MTYLYKLPSPLGPLTLASDGDSITGLWIEGQTYYAATLESGAVERSLQVFADARRWLDCYFSGKEPDFTPSLAPIGGEFRQSVWRILREIPYGQVTTYKAIARQLSSTSKVMAAQAVGGAVGHNPVSIIIPCHRVIGSDGSLTGYAGGIHIKEKLLKLEQGGKFE